MKIKCSMGVFVTLTFVVISTHLVDVTGAPSDSNLHNDTMNLKTETTTTKEDPVTEVAHQRPTPAEEKLKCSQMIGSFQEGVWVGLEVKYDLKSVLEKYGGLPGEVNATWTEKKAGPVENATDERPLRVADSEYWLYTYTGTDDMTWARGEHAVRRFSGTPKEFLEIRGIILWAPEDFCGDLRRASYIVDDRGFSFEVSRQYCSLRGGGQYSCALPAFCRTHPDGHKSCTAAPAIGLLASLVGG